MSTVITVAYRSKVNETQVTSSGLVVDALVVDSVSFGR